MTDPYMCVLLLSLWPPVSYIAGRQPILFAPYISSFFFFAV